MKKVLFVIFLSIFSSLSCGEVEVENVEVGKPKKNEAPTVAEITSSSIAGDFGMGIGIGVNSTSVDYINNAAIVDGRVNITDSESIRTQLWLEAHYLFGGEYSKWTCEDGCMVYDEFEGKPKEVPSGGSYYRNRRFYHGPFFAVQVSDGDSLFNGVALGYMISLKKTSKSSAGNDRYFNLGLGVSSTKVRAINGDYSDGEEFTGNQLTFKNSTETGVLLLFSVNVF